MKQSARNKRIAILVSVMVALGGIFGVSGSVSGPVSAFVATADHAVAPEHVDEAPASEAPVVTPDDNSGLPAAHASLVGNGVYNVKGASMTIYGQNGSHRVIYQGQNSKKFYKTVSKFKFRYDLRCAKVFGPGYKTTGTVYRAAPDVWHYPRSGIKVEGLAFTKKLCKTRPKLPRTL
jgi:hypothetical protein